MIEVIKPGLLSTIQDLGRPGYAHLGVGRSGALDAPSLVAANRLVGNAHNAAGIETTLMGVCLRAEVATIAAVLGAPAPITVDGAPQPFGAAVRVPAGAVLDVGPATAGVRSYVAFAGGIVVAPVLGSRSTDTLSGLGPPPLRAGFVLPLGQPAAPVDETSMSVTQEWLTATPDPEGTVTYPGGAAERFPTPDDPATALAAGRDGVTVRIRMGPRHDWFSVTARDALVTQPFALSVKSNRVGARLSGPILRRAVGGELPSEGIVLGAVQVPADGQPLVFLADHPTTGGYPVIAVVEASDLPMLAQARPGTTVRFEAWT